MTQPDAAPNVTADGLAIVLASNRAGGVRHLWIARRASRDEPFEAPEMIEDVATPAIEDDPWIASDLRTLYFTFGATGVGDIAFATR